jgi:hypothetical protein
VFLGGGALLFRNRQVQVSASLQYQTDRREITPHQRRLHNHVNDPMAYFFQNLRPLGLRIVYKIAAVNRCPEISA